MDEIIEFIKDMFKYIVIIGIIVVIRIYVLTTTEVVGPSMEPNLYNGNVLLVDQLSARFKEYNRFDIVLFEHSPSHLIKRIIGLPGEAVEYVDNKLYINSQVIDIDFKINGDTEDFGPIIVPEDKYFVLGDNRINSTDSRNFGTIEKDRIVGRVFFEIWPFNRMQILTIK